MECGDRYMYMYGLINVYGHLGTKGSCLNSRDLDNQDESTVEISPLVTSDGVQVTHPECQTLVNTEAL